MVSFILNLVDVIILCNGANGAWVASLQVIHSSRLLRWLGQETLEKVPCVWLLVVPVCGGGRELLQMGGEAITDHACMLHHLDGEPRFFQMCSRQPFIIILQNLFEWLLGLLALAAKV